MLLLSDSPYIKLLFHIVSTIIKAFIRTGHQFLYLLLVELGRLWRHHRPQTADRSAARHARDHNFH